MSKEEFERKYPATKGKLVNVLIDKMYEEKLKLLKTFLDESNIFYDETGRTDLSLEEAVSKYGIKEVKKFYHDVLNDYDVWLEAERQALD